MKVGFSSPQEAERQIGTILVEAGRLSEADVERIL